MKRMHLHMVLISLAFLEEAMLDLRMQTISVGFAVPIFAISCS